MRVTKIYANKNQEVMFINCDEIQYIKRNLNKSSIVRYALKLKMYDVEIEVTHRTFSRITEHLHKKSLIYELAGEIL